MEGLRILNTLLEISSGANKDQIVFFCYTPVVHDRRALAKISKATTKPISSKSIRYSAHTKDRRQAYARILSFFNHQTNVHLHPELTTRSSFLLIIKGVAAVFGYIEAYSFFVHVTGSSGCIQSHPAMQPKHSIYRFDIFENRRYRVI